MPADKKDFIAIFTWLSGDSEETRKWLPNGNDPEELFRVAYDIWIKEQ